MARLPRIVNSGFPHHVYQRGNRRQNVFFSVSDKRAYLGILQKQAERYGLKVWAYCLMDNHVHFVAVPKEGACLARVFGETHRRYTRMIHFRMNWRGYLWQGRFGSFPVDTKHLYNLVRYVERNPVRAGIVERAEDYPFSSARAHVKRVKDPLLSSFWLHESIKDWRKYLCEDDEEEFVKVYRYHLSTGRPFGDEEYICELQNKLGISIQ